MSEEEALAAVNALYERVAKGERIDPGVIFAAQDAWVRLVRERIGPPAEGTERSHRMGYCVGGRGKSRKKA